MGLHTVNLCGTLVRIKYLLINPVRVLKSKQNANPKRPLIYQYG
jgi:hypothetical protein